MRAVAENLIIALLFEGEPALCGLVGDVLLVEVRVILFEPCRVKCGSDAVGGDSGLEHSAVP